jgi:arylsulfatase A-like enzyme
MAPRPAKILAALAAALLASAGCGRPAPEGPDVLLISLDSVRADTLDFLDAETAPNLARLARRGTVFTQAVSATSWTLPAHVQMFTGTPPSLSGVQVDSVRIDPLVPTLPELLDQAGWATAGFFTGWYLAAEYGFGRGFGLYRSAMTPLEELPPDAREAASHRDVTSARVAERVAQLLEGADAGRPLFLFTHLFDPHYDYIPPPPFDRRFDPDYDGDLDGRDYWSNRRVWDPEQDPPRRVSDRDLEHLRALYRGEIGWTDQAIGAILEELERDGRLARTLVVVTADHGEEFFEHEGRGHRRTLYDEVLRVPLLVVPPGAQERDAPRTCARQVTLSDLLPTVVDYAGLEVPAGVHGRSLRPAVEGGDLPARPAIASLLRQRHLPDGTSEPWLLQALRTPDSKLVRTLRIGPAGRPRLTQLEWYDLVADPGEAAPLRDLDDPRVRRAWALLEAQSAELRALWGARPRSPVPERLTTVRESFAGELAALGYAEGGDSAGAEAPAEWMLRPLPTLRLDGR